jgi:AcrR family transcriptional regulator
MAGEIAGKAEGEGVARIGRRERRQIETREKILGAAFDLFARQGFFATTIEQITEAADVGKGTFFNYFPSKEHVLAGFAEGQVERVRKALEAARPGKEGIRPIMRRLILSMGEQPRRSPELLRSLLVANLSSEPVRQLTRQNLGRGRRLLAELIAYGQRRGEIRSDRKPLDLARSIQQAGMGVLLVWAVHPTGRLAEWLADTSELIWWGLVAPLPKKKLR